MFRSWTKQSQLYKLLILLPPVYVCVLFSITLLLTTFHLTVSSFTMIVELYIFSNTGCVVKKNAVSFKDLTLIKIIEIFGFLNEPLFSLGHLMAGRRVHHCLVRIQGHIGTLILLRQIFTLVPGHVPSN